MKTGGEETLNAIHQPLHPCVNRIRFLNHHIGKTLNAFGAIRIQVMGETVDNHARGLAIKRTIMSELAVGIIQVY